MILGSPRDGNAAASAARWVAHPLSALSSGTGEETAGGTVRQVVPELVAELGEPL